MANWNDDADKAASSSYPYGLVIAVLIVCAILFACAFVGVQ